MKNSPVFAAVVATTLAAAAVGLARAAETTVSPDAKPVVGQLAQAYSSLKSLQVAGTFKADLDIAGTKRNEEMKFTGSFAAPNRFRHEMTDDVSLGSTGQKLFVYAKEPNVYFTAAAPEGRVTGSELPGQAKQILADQDVSVLLAASKDPEATLKEDVTAINLAPPTTLDGVAYDTLVLSMGEGKPTQRLLLDQKTHLVRQAQTDLKADVLRRGAPDVKRALITIDYTATTADAAIPDTAFAWAAPEGARETSAQQPDAGAAEGAVKDLEGKPAPELALKQLGGGDVKLSDQKGSVVILDFWATWCGPCVEGLPHVDAIYKDKKDQGVKAFAVNMQEDEADVKKFVESKKLSLPVLLEPDGKTAEKYKVEGIPETVVIGKDGKVKKTFVGTGPDTEAQLRKAVEAALAEK